MNRRSERDERGVVAILVAVSLVMLCMSCAMAVDVGNVAQLHRHAQLTVDDAAISGADLLELGTDSLTQVVSASESYIDENWKNLPSSAWDTCPSVPSGFFAPSASGENCVTFNGTSTATTSAINVELPPQSVPFTVARLGGFLSGGVDASASAVLVPGTAPCALCVLGQGPMALEQKGSGQFTVSSTTGNAGIVVDSTDPQAAYIDGSGSITTSGTTPLPPIDVVGNYGVKGKSGTFSPTPTPGAMPVPDPLGALVPPTPTSGGIIPAASCPTSGIVASGTCGSLSLTSNTSVTLPPGNYSGISVGGSSTLTLDPGIYFIDGSFSVGGTGGASVYEAAGVLLYFTCGTATQIAACASGALGGSLSLGGTGSMTLEAQTTGAYAGLTVFQDRNDASPMSLAGTPGLSITGTIYAKSSALTLSGNGGTLSSYIIVQTAQINGTGNLTVNYDAGQNIAPPGTPYLCSTTVSNC